MKACELMQKLIREAQEVIEPSCDTLKAGDPDKTVKKVATCFVPTPEVMREAAAWGADLLITHEPAFCGVDHWDPAGKSEIERAMADLITQTGITVYRFHDHAHRMARDLIHQGFVRSLGIPCDLTEYISYGVGVRRYDLPEPVTAREMAKRIEQMLGVKHVRIVGTTDIPMTKLVLCLGATDAGYVALRDTDAEMALVGETTEWLGCEFVRDANQLGYHKSMLIFGHAGSERNGMQVLAEYIHERYPEMNAKYLEGGEVYTYTDSE